MCLVSLVMHLEDKTYLYLIKEYIKLIVLLL